MHIYVYLIHSLYIQFSYLISHIITITIFVNIQNHLQNSQPWTENDVKKNYHHNLLPHKFVTYVMTFSTYNTQIDHINSASTQAEQGNVLVSIIVVCLCPHNFLFDCLKTQLYSITKFFSQSATTQNSSMSCKSAAGKKQRKHFLCHVGQKTP